MNLLRRRRLVAAALLTPLWQVDAAAPTHTAPPAEADRFAGLDDPLPAAAAAAYLVVLDGQPLWGRSVDSPHPPASLVKLLAALVCTGTGWLPQRWLDVGPRAAQIERHRIGLRASERVRAADALTAMLVASANDAAQVLADGFAGGPPALVRAMNDRAAALGMGRTQVANPSGLDAAGQLSTPADLWRLSNAVMAQPALAATVAQPRGVLQTAGGRTIRFQASNQLLGRVDGVVGIKTGQTARAGRNLIALARRRDGEVLVVLLGARDRWEIASALIEQAFARARMFGPAAAASAASAVSGPR